MIMREKKQSILITICFCIITILFVLNSLLSTEISFTDEMSYIATALRFYQGDALLVEDWSATQMSSILLMPFVSLWYYIVGNSTGIVLFFRLIYLLMKLLITIFAIYRFSRHGTYKIYTVIGIAFYYFFSPYNINTLSYNTIPISMIFLITVITLTHKDSNIDWFFCGVFLAIAILSQPFILLIYVAFSVALAIYKIIQRFFTHKIVQNKEYEKIWLYATLGSISVAFIFFAFIFSRASLSDILNNLPYILNEPDHSTSFTQKTLHLIRSLFLDYIFITIINSICIFMCFIKKQKIFRFFSFFSLLSSCIYLYFKNESFMENLIFIPFMWFALEQILYYKVPKYILPYIMILLSVVGVYFGTNTGILSTSAAMSNFAILSCFIAEDGESQYLKKQQNKMQLYLMTVLILLTLLMRLLIVWRDYFRIEDFQYYISSGPLSGTYTTEQVKNNYYNVINDFDSIHLSENDILFCGTHVPVAYLYSDLQYGTMSVAFSSLNYTRLNAYWELHLDKYPTVIYYNKLSYTDEESEFIDKLYADNWEITITENRLIATKIE